MELRDRVALVTGAASGLGRAAARELHGAGASVVLVDLPGSGVEAEATSLGERAAAAHADVTDEAQVQAAVDLAGERFGGLHVAVSCAGIGRAGRVVGRGGPLPLEDFAVVVRVNLIGTFNVLRLAAAAMSEQEPIGEERGVIVNTASIAAYDGQIGQAAYAASKGGVVALTLPVARDLAQRRIRCMAIAPGTFDTPMLAGLPDEAVRALGAAVPHPSRLGRPEEFGLLVRQIVENPMLNGAVIRLDGALRMAPR
ncbi:MAG TPA: SDR family NAD(P)-dependent oxidoreductase [Candidatus Dormibacteraeota bacterium]|jgi:NAD(P)-dependent dehydrogenase (short-subunit alcohol dehydrogenase family)|nr:SDR family NAD(P)-dependent oxidoreductase [Candidatus Dormibacteraeota bacterium]